MLLLYHQQWNLQSQALIPIVLDLLKERILKNFFKIASEVDNFNLDLSGSYPINKDGG